MPDENAIVEVVAADGDVKVPLGIVSVKQALEMPAEVGLEFSHPEHEAGETEVFVTQDELAKIK